MSVPFIDLTRHYAALKAELDAAILGVAASGRYILGPHVAAFEDELAKYCEVPHGIGVASGSDALTLALRAVGVKAGDEVIVPAFTFIATAEAVSHVGATPVFADVDATGTLDAADVAQRVTARTRAVIPVHLYGQTCDMDPLNALAKRHGLVVIEDAAQAVGARYKGRLAGSLGDIATFSFFPTKNLGAYGDGGFVTTVHAALADRIRLLRTHGSRERYCHEAIGWSSRLDEMQAAVLRVKLQHLESWTERRRALAARYRAALSGLPLELPRERPDDRDVYHLFTIRTPHRDDLQKFLAAQGIGTMVHYPNPLHRQPAYPAAATLSLPECERASREVLSLPLYSELTDAEADEVAAAVRRYFAERVA